MQLVTRAWGIGSMLFQMRSKKSDGVLLVAHGTVTDLGDLPAFLTEIRRGRPPTSEMVHEMAQRYETIGGSPLTRITEGQASALADALQMPVLFGMRFGKARLSDAFMSAAALKLHRLVILPVAPYSVELYMSEAQSAYSRLKSEGHSLGFELLRVAPWGTHEQLIEAHHRSILAHLGGQIPENTRVILTAHSLPLRILEAGDTYAEQVRASANALKQVLARPIELAFQNQGEAQNEWLGPSLLAKLAEVAAQGVQRVVIVPIGFLSEHVETLYDLDHEAQKQAASLGLTLWRVPALNSHPRLISAMAELVRESFQRADSISAISGST
jgi:ferrochelatase